MGGLAGVRRGRTAGDLTGGGGRSVEAVRRGGDPRRSGLSRVFGQGYYGPPSREVPAGGWEPPPPGGGYSGGVIPSFQGGGGVGFQQHIRPRLSPTVAPNWFSGADRWKRNQHLAARGLPMRYQGVPIPSEVIYARQAPVPPGGGYSGGVVPRFQAGGAMEANPFDDPNFDWDKWNGAGRGYVAPQQTPRQAQMQSYLTGTAPRGGGRGWQGGGQFPEAAFPVENQLSDESPWYPDEEVGYEEAVPMQGGFDVFGRSGG